MGFKLPQKKTYKVKQLEKNPDGNHKLTQKNIVSCLIFFGLFLVF